MQSILNVIVGSYVRTHALGAVFGQDTGFQIASDPDTVRAPDLAFVDRARVAQIAWRGYAALAPDLVAEILSPDDRPGEVLSKVGEWLEAGVRLGWVIERIGESRPCIVPMAAWRPVRPMRTSMEKRSFPASRFGWPSSSSNTDRGSGSRAKRLGRRYLGLDLSQPE